MTATAPDLRTREARIYRVNTWRVEIKGREPLEFAKRSRLAGWWQMELFGKPTRDHNDRKKWDHLASKAAGWLREPYYLAAEVKTALRRSSHIPPTNSLRSQFPAPTAKQYRDWAKSETRPPCPTFYDGTPQPFAR